MVLNLPYINFLLNTVASVGYYIITFFLFYLVRQSQLINPLAFENVDVKTKFFFLINCVQILFGLFVGFCSLTHTMQAVKYKFGETKFNKYLETLILLTNATIALITAFVAWKVFPLILRTFEKLEILEKEKMQLVQVVSACQESIIVMSSSLIIIQGNSATKPFFGDNFVGTSILEYVWNTSDLKNIQSKLNNMLLLSNSTAPTVIEYRAYKINLDEVNHETQDREYIWLESSFLKTCNSVTHEVEFTMMTRSIDARKEAESVTKILNEGREQNRINEEKLMYINCVAHDLKTPLQSFSFALDLLKQSDLHPDQLEIIHEASVSIDLMKLTISQAMYIGKALSGVTVSARRTTVSISNILSHVQIIMNGFQPSNDIQYHVSESLCDTIITDEEWVWQMLLNLLTNACKYTDEGFIGVYVDKADDEEMLIFKVVDTGIGIAPNKLSTIFDAFNQAQQGQVVGTGLGLFGVRSRAEALGGSCGVWNNNAAALTGQHESLQEVEYGISPNQKNNLHTKGSTFWFKIPYVDDDSGHNYDSNFNINDDDYYVAFNDADYDSVDANATKSQEEDHIMMIDSILNTTAARSSMNDDTLSNNSFYRVVGSNTTSTINEGSVKGLSSFIRTVPNTACTNSTSGNSLVLDTQATTSAADITSTSSSALNINNTNVVPTRQSTSATTSNTTDSTISNRNLTMRQSTSTTHDNAFSSSSYTFHPDDDHVRITNDTSRSNSNASSSSSNSSSSSGNDEHHVELISTNSSNPTTSNTASNNSTVGTNNYIIDVIKNENLNSVTSHDGNYYTASSSSSSSSSTGSNFMIKRHNNTVTPRSIVKSTLITTTNTANTNNINSANNTTAVNNTNKATSNNTSTAAVNNASRTEQVSRMTQSNHTRNKTLADNTRNNSSVEPSNYNSIYSSNDNGSLSCPSLSTNDYSSRIIDSHNERQPLLSKSEKAFIDDNSFFKSDTDTSISKNLEAIVIDDTATIRKLLTRALLQLGFKRVDCYENGSRGLDAMKLRQVDIVFSDVQMPIMTGPEMANRFREFEEQELQSGRRTHRQPIIAITANQAELISSASAISLFDHICLKPVNMNELSWTVQKFVTTVTTSTSTTSTATTSSNSATITSTNTPTVSNTNTTSSSNYYS